MTTNSGSNWLENYFAKPDSPHMKEVKEVAMAYLITGLTIFALGGFLGLMMRLSQAGIFRIGNNSIWYRFMTFHGDAMFIGVGVFITVGLTFYVLVRALDQPLHSFAWARGIYWLFIAGVVLVALATLGLGFNGSWVFLYPLPIPTRNGESGLWTGGPVITPTIFLIGVTLIGLALIWYTIEVLLTVQQNGPGILRGIGLDFLKKPDSDGNYTWEKRLFPTAVIPLTVNAIGMLLSTPVFAFSLIVMILEINVSPSFAMDALLHKNMLWWFGHPIVYQLLFPIAAVYYMIVVEYAKRPMLGQRTVAFAWFVATIIQLIVWAHHIYMDFVQPVPITIAMQLATYVITLPSLASIFGLMATIWVGDWEWDAPSLFMFTGVVGWFLAGIQGVVNATIWLNTIVHNTLWIPGHFHTMIFLNILMGIFAMIYYITPRFTGKNFEWSQVRIHWLGTIIGASGMLSFWLIAGWLGEPRRYAIPLDSGVLWTLLSVPFVLIMAGTQLFFIYMFFKNVLGADTSSESTATSSAS